MSLMDFIHITSEELEDMGYNFGSLFTVVSDSLLTTALIFFISRWIFSICVDLGRKEWK